jgi:natural product precursor
LQSFAVTNGFLFNRSPKKINQVNIKRRKMKSLKLNVLNKQELSKKAMAAVKGGRRCGCGCCGPSSAFDNAMANYNGGANGLWSKQNCNSDGMWIVDDDTPQPPQTQVQ